jgi:hypothetical protein
MMIQAHRYLCLSAYLLDRSDIVVPWAQTPNSFSHAFVVTTRSHWMHDMEWADYLRDEAAKYRQLAEQIDDPVIKSEMLELASVCEEVADNIEDRLTGG